MSINTLSLPVDIPWKRLAISRDMYAQRGDTLPPKWRTSVAVFAYDPKPEELPDEAEPDERVTYLKVTVTITGYQPDLPELDQNILGRFGAFRAKTAKKNYAELAGRYYPALAALAQVMVFPGSGEWRLDQYPYFSEFEPKKREMVELVSETGEVLTGSASNVNIRKGSSAADSIEQTNLSRNGSSFNLAGALKKATGQEGFGGEVSAAYGSYSGTEEGTRRLRSGESMSLTTVDASREKRESFSHTTNLSQLYQLLDSYHLGTNRAVFYVNPRPHILQNPYIQHQNLEMFVPGLRRLEGIQEFFLVVRRPREMEEICVEAIVETAHLIETTREIAQTPQGLQPISPEHRCKVNVSDGDDFPRSDHCRGEVVIPNGYMLDPSQGGGTYQITFANGASLLVSVPLGVEVRDDIITGSIPVDNIHNLVPRFEVLPDRVKYEAFIVAGSGRQAAREMRVVVHLVPTHREEPKPPKVERTLDLVITARRVSSCATLFDPENTPFWHDYIAYERGLTGIAGQLVERARQEGREAMAAANSLGALIHDQVIASFHSPERYTPGTVSFAHSNTMLNALRNSFNLALDQGYLDRPLLKVVEPELRPQLRRTARGLTLRDTFLSSPQALAARLRVEPLQARRIMAQALGLPADLPSRAYEAGKDRFVG